jgi:hypothetical protein
VAEANRIFGFYGWDRETLSSDCVWTRQVNGRYCAAYVTRVCIRVRAGEAIILREGSGAGESSAATPGQAHEFAAKAAETDATKRALMTFGNAFGLSLYSGTPEARAKAAPAGEMPERLATRPETGTATEDAKPPGNPALAARHPAGAGLAADRAARRDGASEGRTTPGRRLPRPYLRLPRHG